MNPRGLAFPGCGIPRWASLGSCADQPPLLLAAQPEVLNVAGEVVSLVMVPAFDCSCPLLTSTSPGVTLTRPFGGTTASMGLWFWESWGAVGAIAMGISKALARC